MTTPAQYEAAIQALEERIATLNRLIPIYTPHMYADVVVGMKAELAGLESALAIVREARERGAWWNLCVRGEWFRHDGRTHLAIRMADGADLSCRATTEAAMRAAITPEVPDAR